MNILPFCHRLPFIIIFTLIFYSHSYAQLKPKEVTNRPQSWVGFNSVLRLNKHWGISLDANYRTNHFFESEFYTIVRSGVSYWLNENIVLTAGYGHQWTAPTTSGWHTITNEERLYQQVILTQKIGLISIVNRLRNEERWQEQITADTNTHNKIFTDRIRYQLSTIIPLSKKTNLPSLVLSDELFVQMGKTIVFNTFDQNRAFVGLREMLRKDLSVDIGYMLTYQEKSSGYQYNRDHIFRLFFQYNPNFKASN